MEFLKNYHEFLVCIGVLLLTLVIALLFHKLSSNKLSSSPEKTTKNVVAKNSTTEFVTISLSIVTSFMSSISILGPSQLIYKGINWYLIGLEYPLFTYLAYKFIIPKIYPYQSIFSVIRQFNQDGLTRSRINHWTLKISEIIYFISILFYSAGVLFAPCTVLSRLLPATSFFGLLQDHSQKMTFCILLVGLSTSIFVSLGNLRKIVYIDAVQITFIIGVQIFCMGLIYQSLSDKIDSEFLESDSNQNLIQTIYNHTAVHLKFDQILSPNNFINFDQKNLTSNIPVYIIGGTLYTIGLCALSEGIVQRFHSAKNLKQAKNISLICCFWLYVCLFVTCIYGNLATYYYDVFQETLSKTDQAAFKVLSLIDRAKQNNFITTTGLFSGAVLLASVTTLSTQILALENLTNKSTFFSIGNFEKSFKNSATKPMAVKFILGFCITAIAIAISANADNFDLLPLAVAIQSYGTAPVVCLLITYLFFGRNIKYHEDEKEDIELEELRIAEIQKNLNHSSTKYFNHSTVQFAFLGTSFISLILLVSDYIFDYQIFGVRIYFLLIYPLIVGIYLVLLLLIKVMQKNK